MKIIKEGRENGRKHPKIFECDVCGGRFEAEMGEYIPASQMEALHDNIDAKCKCPFCGRMVYKENER